MGEEEDEVPDVECEGLVPLLVRSELESWKALSGLDSAWLGSGAGTLTLGCLGPNIGHQGSRGPPLELGSLPDVADATASCQLGTHVPFQKSQETYRRSVLELHRLKMHVRLISIPLLTLLHKNVSFCKPRNHVLRLLFSATLKAELISIPSPDQLRPYQTLYELFFTLFFHHCSVSFKRPSCWPAILFTLITVVLFHLTSVLPLYCHSLQTHLEVL